MNPERPRPAGHGTRGTRHGRDAWALTAVALAAGYVGLALFAPALLLAAIPVTLGAGCALAPGRCARRRAALLVAAWLSIGVAGAWWWRSEATAGLGWTVGALFVLPLPLVPWLYARWFEEGE